MTNGQGTSEQKVRAALPGANAPVPQGGAPAVSSPVLMSVVPVAAAAVPVAGAPGPVAMLAPPRPASPLVKPPPSHAIKPAGKPIAGAARFERRHVYLSVSFVLVVLLPAVLTAAYLWLLARDQYVSNFAFSVRTEELQSGLDLLGGITKLSGSTSSDLDIIEEFLESQAVVTRLDRTLDLRTAFSRGWPADFVFAFNPAGTVEDLQDHWVRSVEVAQTGGLMRVGVTTYDADDSTRIAEAILKESTALVNALSAEARSDAMRFTSEELLRAELRLKAARGATTEFRMRTQIVDPMAVLQGQIGVLNTLQAQLAEALIEVDLLHQIAEEGDPRVVQADRRIEVIENRLVQERGKFGRGGKGPGGEDYASLFAEFERLSAERQFAEESYRVALVAHEGARSEAQRQSRYLVAHVAPTKAEQSTSPERGLVLMLTTLFLLMGWGTGLLIYYSIRDRR